MKHETIEALAESAIQNHLRHNPGLELVPIHCAVDKRQAQIAHKEDVLEFLDSISSRFDVSEIDTTVPLHTEPTEPEAVDIDLDQPEPVILARKRKHHLVYFAGFFKHRALWTTDSRCAKVFASEESVIMEAFQFAEDDGILKEVFQDLGLQMLPAPRVPE